ncbi:hypothetical protein DENSPDRAFT_841999 [Dentipellis sp. KUC8613]|nr:hypothetical protein DENSPDRAFT_841999 [Dentipellis sp. KUC8613]
MVGPPTSANIVTVARRAVGVLRRRGILCYVVGSLASMLWGCSRDPNDIDLVILTTAYDAEEIKQMLVDSDGRFSLVDSRNPRNSYKVLWYEFPESTRFSENIKVDILVPPTLNMPLLHARNIVWMENLPVCPLLLLLHLRLQGWEHHTHARRRDLVEKQFTDIVDIEELLAIVVELGATIEDAPGLNEPFRTAIRRRLRSFARMS